MHREDGALQRLQIAATPAAPAETRLVQLFTAAGTQVRRSKRARARVRGVSRGERKYSSGWWAAGANNPSHNLHSGPCKIEITRFHVTNVITTAYIYC